MPLLPKVAEQHGHNYGQHSIHVVTRENDCQHLYSMFFDLVEADFLHWVVNNGHFLNDLIANYNVSAKDVILEAKEPGNRIVLPNSSALNLSDNQETKPSKRLTVFHKYTNIPVHLSNQQSACLALLVQGKSAKEIGRHMQLSPRTVEHYMDIIRKLLGVTSNKELLAAYIDQLMQK
jgi:DNA-binding CsgD family transcriptional regulator